MAIPEEVKKVDNYSTLVDAVYNVPSIPDADLDKDIFSNNYYKGKSLSVINDHNLSTTDASNYNAQNLNSSMVHREDVAAGRVLDEATLATVTRATCGIPYPLAKQYGAVDPAEPVALQDFSLYVSIGNIAVGGTGNITIVPIPANADTSGIVLTSSNTAVMTIAGNVYTGVAAGTANVVATHPSVTHQVPVTVTA